MYKKASWHSILRKLCKWNNEEVTYGRCYFIFCIIGTIVPVGCTRIIIIIEFVKRPPRAKVNEASVHVCLCVCTVPLNGYKRLDGLLRDVARVCG